MKTSPPVKRNGQGTGPRRFNGQVLDVRTASELIGATEKYIRGRVARRLIPFRRCGGRILFMRDELLEYHRRLPGCGLNEALENCIVRQGGLRAVS